MGSLGWYLDNIFLFIFDIWAINRRLYFIKEENKWRGIQQTVMLLLYVIQGTMKLSRLAKSLSADVNVKRRAKGLLPRPVSFSKL